MIIRERERERENVNTVLLVFLEIRETHEGQLVPYEGFRCRERLHVALIILNVIEITRIDIAAQLGYDGGGGCTTDDNTSARFDMESLNICVAHAVNALGTPARLL